MNNNKYGTYGIIKKSNLFTKYIEFKKWLQIEKSINLEIQDSGQRNKNIGKYEEEFIRLYNNCDLPHIKYYDITKYEAKKKEKHLKEAKKDNKIYEFDGEKTEFNDENEKKNEKKIKNELIIKEKIQEAYSNIDSKLEEIKERERMKKLMIQYYKTGQEESAREIHNKYYSNKIK